jgi:hypothetical protein
LEEDAGAESSALCRAILKVKPTFSRNGQEIWVTIRGETRIAILDTDALQHLRAEGDRQCDSISTASMHRPKPARKIKLHPRR